MKSCPSCNRTFDDTMSFCLIDGAILSAPFDPRTANETTADRRPESLPTQMLNSPPNAPVGPARDASVDVMPPTTAGKPAMPTQEVRVAPTQAAELPLTREGAVHPPVLETIRAPMPEFAPRQKPGATVAAQSALPDYLRESQPRTGGRKPLAITLAGVVALMAIGAIVWLALRSRNHPAATVAGASQSEKQSGKKAASGQPFVENVGSTKIDMLYVQSGTFLMGSPVTESERDKDEGPQSEVTVTGFNMSKYEITQAQYKAVMGSNPSTFRGDDLPVDGVSWADAVEFCRKLSSNTGRQYRLPTEAEWEYACRAGTKGPFPGNVESLSWYDANAGNQTHPVGQKQPNGFGLYDMNGNVWEWCQSKYEPYPYQATDGREDLQSNDTRVMRGGSWKSPAKGCRSAYRRRVPPDGRTIGFRIVSVG
jgi:formylglycine-generating enzyme required for sulfatase activity